MNPTWCRSKMGDVQATPTKPLCLPTRQTNPGRSGAPRTFSKHVGRRRRGPRAARQRGDASFSPAAWYTMGKLWKAVTKRKTASIHLHNVEGNKSVKDEPRQTKIRHGLDVWKEATWSLSIRQAQVVAGDSETYEVTT